MKFLRRTFSSPRGRLLQRITRVHRIHDIRWSWGWTLPLTSRAYFEKYGWKSVDPRTYHDCTATGRY